MLHEGMRNRQAHSDIHRTYSVALCIFAIWETDVKLEEEARVFMEFLMRNCIMRSSPYSPGNFSPQLLPRNEKRR